VNGVGLQARLRSRQSATIGLIVLAFVVIGVVHAFVWSRMAPGIASKVLADGRWGQMPTASNQAFASVAIFAMLGLAVGIIGALLVWQVKAVRGPVGLSALLIGTLIGGAVAFVLAPMMASGVDPALVGATGSEVDVMAAPVLTAGTMSDLARALFYASMIVVPAAAAAFVYTFAVFLNDRGDLGRPAETSARPGPGLSEPQDPPTWPTAVQATPVPNGAVPNGALPNSGVPSGAVLNGPFGPVSGSTRPDPQPPR